MPTRTYQCTNEKCENKEFELEMSVNEKDSDILCPTCQSSVQRLFRPINSIWKTSGSHGKSSNN